MGSQITQLDGKCYTFEGGPMDKGYVPTPCPSGNTATPSPAPAPAQPASPGMLESLYNSFVDFFSSDTSAPTPATQPAPQPTPAPASGKDEYVCSPSPAKKCWD